MDGKLEDEEISFWDKKPIFRGELLVFYTWIILKTSQFVWSAGLPGNLPKGNLETTEFTNQCATLDTLDLQPVMPQSLFKPKSLIKNN